MSGGNSVVSCTWGSPGRPAVCMSNWHLECRMYICRDGYKETIVSWWFRNWSTFPYFQVCMQFSEIHYLNSPASTCMILCYKIGFTESESLKNTEKSFNCWQGRLSSCLFHSYRILYGYATYILCIIYYKYTYFLRLKTTAALQTLCHQKRFDLNAPVYGLRVILSGLLHYYAKASSDGQHECSCS